MNIHEAIKSGQPFAHPDMIGAFKLFENKQLVHHDNPINFVDPDNKWHQEHGVISDAQTKWCLRCLTVDDLLRTDWYLLDLTQDPPLHIS